MADWWYVIAVVALAAVGLWYLRARSRGASPGRDARSAGAGLPRDFPREREDARVAQMSEEDRAWETASSERNRERQAQDRTP